MKNNWEKDKCLSALFARINEYDLFSFDVFDTILYRTCSEPEDVFELTGQMLAERINGWPYSSVAFKALRKEAEHRARSRKSPGIDCTFEEILAELPFTPETINVIKRTEIECEKQVLYLNDNIYSLMCECASRDKKIVLVSDMYHSREQVSNFLAEAGMDNSLISDCFISSEQGCMKSGGDLFGKVLSAFPDINPDRILHIGDSLKADVDGAKKAGLNTLHYDILTFNDFGSFYDLEKYRYKTQLGEITSLRRLTASTHICSTDSDEAFFHQLGAEIIGPVYALFAEWIVNYASERGIGIILPFMREGELFSKVISKVIQVRGLNISCKPLYVSRLPAFISSIFESNYDERISQVLLRGGRTLKVVFHELGLDAAESVFAADMEQKLEDLAAIGKIKEIEEFLVSDKTRNDVISYSAEQRRLLLRYLYQMTEDRLALTVDIGTKGTTERYLNDIRKIEQDMPAMYHALMMGSMTSNTENILNGINISAWLGIAGENDSLISKIMYQVQIIETLVNATCGSVSRYEQNGNEVRPVLEPVKISEYQKRMINTCWEGIETFQNYWTSLAAKKTGLCERLLTKKVDFLNILMRLIEMPTIQEAERIGALYYNDGFNSEQYERFVNQIPESDLNDSAIGGFIASELKNGKYWPQAVVAVKRPGYFNRLLINSINDSPAYSAMLAILEEIQARELRVGVIFCASELGRKFQKLAEMLNITISCFVDSDRRMHGTAINGLPVRPLNEVPEKVDYFIIATYIYSKEIRTILEVKYPNKRTAPVFFDFGNLN